MNILATFNIFDFQKIHNTPTPPQNGQCILPNNTKPPFVKSVEKYFEY